MTAQPFRRITGGAIGSAAPLLGRGPVAALVEPHPYLIDYRCGARLYHGVSEDGAPLFVCRTCNSIADKRRVS